MKTCTTNPHKKQAFYTYNISVFCRRWFQLFDDLNFFYTLELLSSVRSVVFVYPVWSISIYFAKKTIWLLLLLLSQAVVKIAASIYFFEPPMRIALLSTTTNKRDKGNINRKCNPAFLFLDFSTSYPDCRGGENIVWTELQSHKRFIQLYPAITHVKG